MQQARLPTGPPPRHVDLSAELAVWDPLLDRGAGAPAAIIDLDAERAVRRAATRRRDVSRRLGAALAVLGLAIAMALLVGGTGATADLRHAETAGQVVLTPGDTLWDVAVEHAPPGVDARAYLHAIRELNGLATPRVAAWTTVLLPAAG